MTMYYVAYLPSLKIVFVSDKRDECVKYFETIGRDYDEDYFVLTDIEFIQMVKKNG
jgi:hypothetical protein